MVASFAVIETASRILPTMLPSHGYLGFSAAPVPSGWVRLGDSWVLWWSGGQIANVRRGKNGYVRVRLDARKMWQAKDVQAASIGQGMRYAERWCAARIYPELRLRACVARLLDGIGTESLELLPGLQLTPVQQQQARRLAGATTSAAAQIREALEPRPSQERKTR